MIRIALGICVSQLLAVAAGPCTGNPPAKFRLSVVPEQGGPARPITAVNRLLPGYHLHYEPATKGFPEDARIALVLGPSTKDRELVVLDPKPARQPAEWAVPLRTSVVALVYGPKGLSAGKIRSLGEKNPELLAQLAGYAEQSAKVEGLVDALAQSERGETTMEAALAGFSSRYGVAMPRLDPKASTDQQASVLLRALLPAVSTYDPLSANRATVMQQSAGLATSVAAMFWGNPVGLAAGGAALFQNFRTLLFPGSEFRSAFVQPSEDNTLALCGNQQPTKSRTRLAFLWAQKIPDAEAPALSLLNDYHLPLRARSEVSITGAGLPLAGRLSGWRLTANGAHHAVPVAPGGDRLMFDLRSADIPVGTYEIAADWDWQPAAIQGRVHLHRLEDLSTARLSPGSVLIEGAGKTAITLAGPDFQFLEKAALGNAELEFRLPNGRRGGAQRTVDLLVDTAPLRHGPHTAVLVQPDGSGHRIELPVLPPNPVLQTLPVRVNLGERQQLIQLRGTGLDRIEAIELAGASVELLDGSEKERMARVVLPEDAAKGASLAANLQIQGLPKPIEQPGFAVVVGPRPRITSVSASPGAGSILRQNELAAGAPTSFSISIAGVEGPPALELYCRDGAGTQRLGLRPGEPNPAARLDSAGQGVLFLSLDPGRVGQAGCLVAAEIAADTGRSDAIELGRVVRVPRIDAFTLTDEKLADGVYAGLLTGAALETVEKTGWNEFEGLPVPGIPAPLEGDATRQRLKIAVPWPSPAPHAPIFVWLRGEPSGRPTGVKY